MYLEDWRIQAVHQCPAMQRNKSEFGLIDSTANQVVGYRYDTWGNPVSMTDTSGTGIVNGRKALWRLGINTKQN